MLNVPVENVLGLNSMLTVLIFVYNNVLLIVKVFIISLIYSLMGGVDLKKSSIPTKTDPENRQISIKPMIFASLQLIDNGFLIFYAKSMARDIWAPECQTKYRS